MHRNRLAAGFHPASWGSSQRSPDYKVASGGGAPRLGKGEKGNEEKGSERVEGTDEGRVRREGELEERGDKG